MKKMKMIKTKFFFFLYCANTGACHFSAGKFSYGLNVKYDIKRPLWRLKERILWSLPGFVLRTCWCCDTQRCYSAHLTFEPISRNFTDFSSWGDTSDGFDRVGLITGIKMLLQGKKCQSFRD